MTEQEYIISTFNQNFSSYKDSNIVLYGIGNYTKIILDAFAELNFIALMDGFQNDGEAYGKSIIPVDKLIELNTDLIVIVARASSVKIIYKRISEYCIDHGIPVFDIYGNKLTEENNIKDYANNFNLSEDDIKKAIKEHEIISFDIFDTLLIRKVYDPQDVFQIVQDRSKLYGINFVKQRIQIERQLAQTNPSLDTIYEELGKNLKLSILEMNLLKHQELEIERQIITKRKQMQELLNYAISLNKPVYLISDMYLPKKYIINLLNHNGIKGYKDIYISCEYKTGKRQELFNIYLNHIKGMSYLHIGDDKDADGIFARMKGIDSILIDKPIDLFEMSSYGCLMERTSSFEERIELSLLSTKLFNNPFALYHSDSRPAIFTPFEFGYIFLGSLMTNFVLWLIDNLKAKEYEHILFLARDGYLIEQLYNKAVEILNFKESLPKSIYFLSSRLAAISATADTKENITYAAGLAFDGTLDSMIENRFLLKSEKINVSGREKVTTLDDYIEQHESKIKIHAKQLKKQYLQYINKLGIQQDENIAFFDFVSTGTCQMCLEELINHKMQGFYFMQLKEDYIKKEQLSICSYYDKSSMYEKNNSVVQNYFLLESFIKALDPSISHFNHEGKPVYLEEKRNNQQLVCIKQLQNGITDYFIDYLNLIKGKQTDLECTNADKILNLMTNNYSRIYVKEFKDYIIRDEFCNRNIDIDSYLQII